MEETLLTRLWQSVAAPSGEQLYAIVDTAAHTHIHSHIQAWEPPAVALQPAEYNLPDDACPWLVTLKKGNTFSDWYLQEGFFTGWGVLLHSADPLLALAEELTPWLLAQNTDKQQLLLMRYYDPTLIYAYLSQLTPDERQQWFGNIRQVLRPTGVEYDIEGLSLDDSKLTRQEITLAPEEGEAANDEQVSNKKEGAHATS